ncbi:hypothetical protein [Microcoleus sp. B9-D4]|uniref:hypothetical protein n=1 Tax=Microcoleus sp. B9-D4 TaxID=2818711 RepID=UPI002FD18EFA
MRRIRLFALGIVSFITVLMGALLAPGTFVNRALSAALCSVFSFNSTICTVNLVNSSDRVVAATPPAVERNIADWLVQRAPGEFDDAPSAPPGSNPQAPPFPQDPGPNIIRPEFNDPGSRIDPSLMRPLPPPDVTGKCDFSIVGTSREDQKCFGAVGNQCEGGVPIYPPRYNNDTCMVEMYATPGSARHDDCCVNNPRGYACGGFGNRHHTEDPNTSVCKNDWDEAVHNVTSDYNLDQGIYKDSGRLQSNGIQNPHRNLLERSRLPVQRYGHWQEYGPYYSLTGTWTAKRDPFYTADREPGCHPGSIGAPSFGANEFIMVQSRQSISIPGNFGGWSSTTGSKGYGSAAGGTVSGKVFTLSSTEGGFTSEHTGTISSVKDGRNTITGRVVCSHSSGSAKAEGSFTFTRKKS